MDSERAEASRAVELALQSMIVAQREFAAAARCELEAWAHVRLLESGSGLPKDRAVEVASSLRIGAASHRAVGFQQLALAAAHAHRAASWLKA